MTAPISATNLTRQFDGGEAQPNDPGATIDWAHLVDRLAAGGTFWLTTMDVDGQPHTRPVFAVVVDQAQRRLQSRVTLMQMAKAG